MCYKSANEMYNYTENMFNLYSRLQDKQSKEIFWARMHFEAEPDLDRALAIGVFSGLSVMSECINWREEFQQAAGTGKKVILYGAGMVGGIFAKLLQNSGVDFYAFCDMKRHGETIYGKPVLPPEELVCHAESYAVVICTMNYYEEILAFLNRNAFPPDSILNCGKIFMEKEYIDQYRDFPELFRKNTAIVDAGCYDGTDTIRFSEWCGGQYSKIYAFEPDEKNYAKCQEAISLAGLTDVVLLPAGLDEISGKSVFTTTSTTSSYLNKSAHIHQTARPSGEDTIVNTYALDDVVDTEIGMIKMDIEGAEFGALHGAEKVIQRDKPLLAICVYHRQGDMLAIMEYLHELVPEYRFWLRHYGVLDSETVLYAAI